MIERSRHVAAIEGRLRDYPVVGILGARQVGKTTLAQLVEKSRKGPVTRIDLESPEDRARLDDPMRALKSLRGLVILDEVHRLPEVFQILRVLADRPRKPARFLVLGSASPELLQQSSESLAGRISYYELPGLVLEEVGSGTLDKLWVRGGFPRSFLARSAAASLAWRSDFITTFLERDLPQFGITVPAPRLRRFWTMLAHYHGQVWNASEIARSLDATYKQAQGYLDVLTSLFVVRQLQPWRANLKKRQVKSPKVYLTDSGLLHALLGLGDLRALEGHPKVGASWEGFMLREVVQRLRADERSLFFWGTHAGAELDLLVSAGRQRLGFEFKRTVAPQVTRSMLTALEDLDLTSLTIVHAGEHTFDLRPKIRAVAASRLVDDLAPLRR